MELSIIIVTYNSAKHIKSCLGSVIKSSQGLKYEIIVIDNNSADNSADLVARDYQQVRLQVNKENLGFAKAVNQGIRASQGKYILLLNPDMVVLDQAIIKCLRYAQNKVKRGIVGIQYLDQDYNIQPSFGNYPSSLTEFFQATYLYKILPFGRNVPYRIWWRHWFKDTLGVDWVAGGFMMFSRETVKKIGPLDEEIFMYIEDIDYCRRVKKEGWPVIYYPAARVIHHHFGSAPTDFSRIILSETKALVHYFKKYRQDTKYLYRFIYLRFYLQIIRYSVAGLFNQKSKELLASYRKAFAETKKILS